MTVEDPLWTDAHAPSLSELPQDDARRRLERAVDEPMNLLVYGPPGAGKTAAVRALAREAHEDPDNDLIVINVDDFFGRSKSDIKSDPRFAPFLAGRSDMAKRDMINHVLKETASYAPVSGEYKTVLLDSAESIREDFQQALRRVMERYHRTTQFVVATRQPTKLIAPIRSRCFAVPVRAPTADETAAVLETILDREGADHDAEAVEYVANAAEGNLREAILSAQTVHAREGELTVDTAHDVLSDFGDDRVESMLVAAEDGDVGTARSELGELLGEGMDGEEILDETMAVARRRYSGSDRRLAAVHELAGEVDFDLAEGSGRNDRVHLTHFLSKLADRVG